MNTTLAMMAVAGIAATAAHADVVLLVDLTTPNQITISATSGASAVTASGSPTTGFYLAGIFGGTGAGAMSTFGSQLGPATLSTFNNAPDGSPLLFRVNTNEPGLNIWSFTSDANATFTAGAQAFQGSATWTLDADTYAQFAGGATIGNIYFPMDDMMDLPNAQIVGQYQVIPAPGALAFLSLGGLAAARRRR